MKGRLLLAAALIVVASNVYVLVHAARNRSDALDAEMDLTERELNMVLGSAEDSAVVLRLRWQNTAQQWGFAGTGKTESGDWFQREKLRELGFNVSVSPDAPVAPEFYRRARSREVFAALEFDGPAWERWIQAKRAAAPLVNETFRPQANPGSDERTFSRLVAIDAARSGAGLRARYPDRKRVLILRSLARPMLIANGSRPPTLRGVLITISPNVIHVPPDLLPRVLQWHTGRYRATIRVGLSFEPWLADFQKVDAQ